MRTNGKISAAVLFLVLMGVTSSLAGSYVSWKGGFHITYPDQWHQIDYQTVDVFLFSNMADKSVLDYEAVFADTASRPFFQGTYLIVAIDSTGKLSDNQVDSVLQNLGKTFGRNVRRFSTDNLPIKLKSKSPVYDAENKLVTVLNDIVQDGKVIKKNLMMMKFYDKGTASFYLYTPDSLFEKGKSILDDIVGSFSTENLEDAATQPELKVTNITPDESSTEEENDKSNRIYLYLGVALVLIMIIVIRRLR
ncbi:MAG: hypothetical protein U9R56_06605 [candidate division Zixibacteria bacterium]|nr:hypothetical protein [candidate division Zixibacteria bacterium]